MKINFILPFKRMSGGIRVIYIYANYLASRGHDVCCYVPMVSYRGENQSTLFRIRASLSNTIKKEKWFDCKFPVRVVPLIKNNFIRDADVVIATAWQTAYDVKKLSQSKGQKYYFVQGYEVFNGDVDKVEGTYSLGIPIITISKDLQTKISEFSTSVTIVHNGLFDSEYITGEKPRNGKLTLMLMYHEAQHKGMNEGLQVIHEIEKKVTDIQIIIFGMKIGKKFPANYIVVENPSRNELMKLYQQADIYLFTSKIEAWGLPIVEAMANKNVVIGRELGALEELYDGRNAIIVNSTSEMQRAVLSLHDDRKHLYEIQNNAYYTAERLNWSLSADLFEKLIKGEDAQ